MISICILNWNCLDVLKKTLSILNEDLKNFDHEIIIYDQNSNDGTQEYLKKIESNRLITIFSNTNVGNSISRNKMINIAKYKYILLLDSDIIPIKDSIKQMISFMEENPKYVYLGYDWESYSNDEEKVTKKEEAIESKDIIDWKHTIALTQYGIFKKSVLIDFPFPEFYPFDRHGWGAEDNIVGLTIFNNNIGVGGTIKNRIYFHNKGSSQKSLGKDTHQRMYVERLFHLHYFKDFLNKEEQKNALKNKILPRKKLKCNKYYWDSQINLGDVATDYVLKEYFPFLEFDKEEKNNLFMFGGTIFNHIENANKKYNANFKNILYFGVGLSKKTEIDHALSIIKTKKINYTIIPRGPKSEIEFKSNGIRCERPCGDVLQLFAHIPKAHHDPASHELLVYDIWHHNLIKPKSENYKTIRIADNGSLKEIPFYDIHKFLDILNVSSKIYSSQIHPILISALLGKPCSLHRKDWRAFDFNYFNGFKLNMSIEDSDKFRSSAQNNVWKFASKFFNNIKMFS